MSAPSSSSSLTIARWPARRRVLSFGASLEREPTARARAARRHAGAPFPAAKSSGGSPQWSASFSGAPWRGEARHKSLQGSAVRCIAAWREKRTPRRASEMCSFTQSYMPSTQSRQMLHFSGTKRPVCATAGASRQRRCGGEGASAASRATRRQVERHGCGRVRNATECVRAQRYVPWPVPSASLAGGRLRPTSAALPSSARCSCRQPVQLSSRVRCAAAPAARHGGQHWREHFCCGSQPRRRAAPRPRFRLAPAGPGVCWPTDRGGAARGSPGASAATVQRGTVLSRIGTTTSAAPAA